VSVWPPEPATTPKDALILYYRNWGRELAEREADRMLAWLGKRGWYFCRGAQYPMVEADLQPSEPKPVQTSLLEGGR